MFIPNVESELSEHKFEKITNCRACFAAKKKIIKMTNFYYWGMWPSPTTTTWPDKYRKCVISNQELSQIIKYCSGREKCYKIPKISDLGFKILVAITTLKQWSSSVSVPNQCTVIYHSNRWYLPFSKSLVT